MGERIENLRTAIETRHKCKAVHERSAVIVEKFGGKTAWEGVVLSFTLTGHAKTKRCYALSYRDRKEIRYVKVLEIPPVISPETAVRALIVADSK